MILTYKMVTCFSCLKTSFSVFCVVTRYFFPNLFSSFIFTLLNAIFFRFSGHNLFPFSSGLFWIFCLVPVVIYSTYLTWIRRKVHTPLLFIEFVVILCGVITFLYLQPFFVFSRMLQLTLSIPLLCKISLNFKHLLKSVVAVEAVYEIPNGIVGMKRSVFLRLCDVMSERQGSITAMVGMCGEHYEWRTHPIFTRNRPLKLPVVFSRVSTAENEYTLSRTHCGKVRCVLGKREVDAEPLFFKHEISVGSFRWTVRLEFPKILMFSHFVIGTVAFHRRDQSSLYSSDACSLSIHHFGTIFFASQSHTNSGDNFRFSPTTPYNVDVALEVDATARTVCFFIDEKLHCAVSGVPVPLHFGIGCDDPFSSFVTLSFLCLRSPSRSLIKRRFSTFEQPY